MGTQVSVEVKLQLYMPLGCIQAFSNSLVDPEVHHDLFRLAFPVRDYRFKHLSTSLPNQDPSRVKFVTAVKIKALNSIGPWVLQILENLRTPRVNDLKQVDCRVPDLQKTIFATSENVAVRLG